jgi:hypothetical protein
MRTLLPYAASASFTASKSGAQSIRAEIRHSLQVRRSSERLLTADIQVGIPFFFFEKVGRQPNASLNRTEMR